MISTYYRRPDAGDPAALFTPPPAPIADPLTGAVPTWRMTEEPIYLDVVRDLGIPGLGVPAAGDVVEGVIVDGPPTVVLELAGPPTRPLPVLERKPARKRPARRGRQRQRQREAGRGELLLLLLVVLVVAVFAVTMTGFVRSVERDIRDRIPCVVATSADCTDGSGS